MSDSRKPDTLLQSIMERRDKLSKLPARDAEILKLARRAVNASGFACQGAEQGNSGMQMRYEQQSSDFMKQLEDLLLKDSK